MTICIAALAEYNKIIVLCSDSMISAQEFSGDRIADKRYPVSLRWTAMVTADDMGGVMPVLEEARNRFADLPQDLYVAQAQRVFAESYQKVRRQAATDLLLATYGISMQDFLRDGQQMFGDTFAETKAKLDAFDLRCEFLVAGFDQDGDGHIFSVQNPGIVRDHTAVGYWAVGMGAHTALGIMFHHSMNHDMPAGRVLYHVAEAKFMSENADGVGEATNLEVFTPDGGPVDLEPIGIENLRKAWNSQGRPRVPTGLAEHIDKKLSDIPGIKEARERVKLFDQLGRTAYQKPTDKP